MRLNWKTILCGVLLIAAAAAVLLQLPATLGRVQDVREEMARTPTPSPVYGSVMVITPDPAATPTPMVLKNGSIGSEVTELQQRLQALGYYSGEIDGQFGPASRTAVTRFQQQHGLDADGAAGPETLALLYSDAAQPMRAEPTPAPETATPAPTATPTAAAKMYITADGYPLLVNKTHPLADSYVPFELVEMNRYCPADVVKIKWDNTLAEKEAVDALLVMLRAAIADGVGNWQVSAAYRDTAYQQRLLDRQIRTYMDKNGLSRSKAETAALKVVAKPGTSEHHIGTCFDITVPNTSAFKGTKQHAWIAEHCWEYGFILRYAEDKESITGFTAEAWHYRWVGREHALRMREENLCLEEYLEKYAGWGYIELGDE